MIVVIPSYEPDEKLITVVRGIRSARPDLVIMVVDDGSGPAYAEIFAETRDLGCVLLSHPVNRGKGAALKSAFRRIERDFGGQDVVCADSDGQHRLEDILRVADRIEPRTMVLGARRFTGRVPARSRFGNAVTRGVFALATGTRLLDTQTGLRAYPASLLGWLQTVPGDRFEYELNLLLQAKGAGVTIQEVEIATVYLQHNASSHFRPIVDSARIYAPILRFAGSSLSAFFVDAGALFALSAVTSNLALSVIGARLISGTFNFTVNRKLVFDREGRTSVRSSALRYALLAVTLLLVNLALIEALTGLGLGLVLAKIVTEVTLVLASYVIQARLVFVARAWRRRSGAKQSPFPGSPEARTTPSLTSGNPVTRSSYQVR